MDRRFQDWETNLPVKLRWRKPSAPTTPTLGNDSQRFPPDCNATPERFLFFQRNTLSGWFLCALMNLHRPYLMHSPPILPPPGSAAGPRTKIMLNPSRERCIEIAIELTRVMCVFHDDLQPWREPGKLAGVFSYFLFDGAVALAGALSQVPPHPQSAECLALLDKAMTALADQVEQAEGCTDGEGENARRALVILKALRRAGRWDRKDEEKGELVLLQDMLMQARRNPPPHHPPPAQQGASLYPSDNGDFYPPTNLGAASSQTGSPSVGFAAQPGMAASANSGAGASTSSAFIPYLNSPPYPPYPSSSTFSSRATPGPLAPFPAMPADFSDIDMSFTGMRSPVDMMRPAQSMVSPFDVLQGVQPDSQPMEDLDLDWARLAGMESWYSGTASG